jgi:CheY-like chemotaxis protein
VEPTDIVRGHEKILLVDDEDMVLDVGRKLLERLEYSVLTADSGAKALKLYAREHAHIDLVILDMIMPEMGGSETFDRLKALNPAIKVLLSSGYSVDGQATEILQRGCSGFIQKPFTIQKLSKKLRQLLETEQRAEGH